MHLLAEQFILLVMVGVFWKMAARPIYNGTNVASLTGQFLFCHHIYSLCYDHQDTRSSLMTREENQQDRWQWTLIKNNSSNSSFFNIVIKNNFTGLFKQCWHKGSGHIFFVSEIRMSIDHKMFRYDCVSNTCIKNASRRSHFCHR